MKQKTKIFAFLSTLWAFGYALFAGEQDNWYLAKEWEMDNEIRGLDYYRESSTGLEKIYVATNNGIQVLDMNGTLLQTLVQNQYVNDVEVDENGTLFYITNDSLHSMSNSPGRVVSVTVDHNGSQYRQSASGSPFYNYNENGNSRHYPYLEFNSSTGSGARAYVRMEENSTDTDNFNRYATEVVVLDGGSGYTAGTTKAFIARNSSMDGVNYSSYNNMQSTVGIYDEANFTVVIGTNWGEVWSTNIPSTYHCKSIAVSPNTGDLFVADAENHKILVLDRNGSIKREFGSSGSAPGQFVFERWGSAGCELDFLENGTLVVADQSHLHFYNEDGTFLSRTNASNYSVTVGPDGTLFSSGYLRYSNGSSTGVNTPFSSSSLAFTPSGDVVQPYGNKVRIWKRAYRTKGLPTPNALPLPAIRGISQRAGTNIIDLDFEILDADDSNATVGVLAAVNGDFSNPAQWILPTAWVDYTEDKIGTPIETNVVHRVSWEVKGDWVEQTGTLHFEVLAQDARRSQPVDLHFLELPLAGGSLTISRSPVKADGMVNHYKHQLAMGAGGLSLTTDGTITDGNGTLLVNSNLQVSKAGRDRFIASTGHRWAKMVETSLAREAATPGGVNQWTASNQIQPRNLPGQVNEYGFDVGSHGSRAWWVVKASTLPFPDFNSTVFDNNGSNDQQFGRTVATNRNLAAVGIYNGRSDTSFRKVHLYEISENNGSLSEKSVVQPDDLNFDSSRYFGSSLSLDNGSLAVGAYAARKENYSGDYNGAVYLFDVNGSYPTQTNRVTASDGSSDDYFGSSVALSGDSLLIGAPSDDEGGYQDSGSAYLFQRESNGTLSEVAKLTDPDGRNYDFFGQSVAVEGEFLGVGAPYADVTANGNTYSDSGKVLLFRNYAGSVTLTDTLSPPNPSYSTYFGYSIARSGDFLVVGEHGRTDQYYEAGAAYLYKLSTEGTATLTATLSSPVPTNNGYYGYSVAMEGNRLLIGAFKEDSENATDSGAAYLYSVSAEGKPTLLERFTHPNGKADDYFGESVGVSGKNALIGAYQFDLPNNRFNAGSAVLFRESN